MLDDLTGWLHGMVEFCAEVGGSAYDLVSDLGADSWSWILSTGAARWAAWFAGAALALGIWQEIRAWRSRPRVILSAKRIGTRDTSDDLGNALRTYGVCELTNGGDGTAASLAVIVKGATQIMEDGFLFPNAMQPFQTVRFLIEPAAAPAAWLHLSWFSRNHRVAFVAWTPINDFYSDELENPLSDVVLKQLDERHSLKFRPWRRIRAKPQAVGPDGVAWVRIRRGRRTSKKEKTLDAAFDIVSGP